MNENKTTPAITTIVLSSECSRLPLLISTILLTSKEDKILSLKTCLKFLIKLLIKTTN